MKKPEIKFEDGKVIAVGALELDTNKDGEPSLKVELNIELDLAEMSDEAWDAVSKKRAEKKA